MQFSLKTVAALASILSTTFAVQVPSDLANGIYSFNDDGNFTQLKDLGHVSRLRARQTSNDDPQAIFTPSRFGCHSSGGNGFDLDNAARRLGDWCNEGNKIAKNEHYAIVESGVVVYACSRRQDLPCGSDGVNTGLQYISDNCAGSYGKLLHVSVVAMLLANMT